MPKGPKSSDRSRLGGAGLVLAYAALVALAAASWRRGLSPPSLGLDDLWVALLVKYFQPADLLTYQAPVPIGFVAASKPFLVLIDQPELGLQVLPFLCSLALIPLSGWLASRVTGRWEIGLLAAVLVLLHPGSGAYAVRVKQFTWDAALTLTVLGVGLPYLDPARRPRPWLLAGVAGTALVASFNTIFAGAIVLHLLALQTLLGREARIDRRAVVRVVIAVLAYDAFAVLLYVARLQVQAKDWVVVYWQRHWGFPPARGLDLAWVWHALERGYGRWLRFGWGAVSFLPALGVGWLLLQSRHRWQGLALAAMGVVLPAAALALVYPFGGGRTDFYFQPVLAVAGAIGVGAIAQLGRTLASWARLPRLAPTVAVLIPLATAALFLGRTPLPSAVYGTGEGKSGNKDLVETMDEIARPDDLILFTPLSRSNVGYYTRIPLEVDFDDPDANLYSLRLTGPKSRLVDDLKSDLAQGRLPDRVVFVAMITKPFFIGAYRRMFEDAGYRLEFDKRNENGTSALQVFTRDPAPSQPPPHRD